MPAVVVKDCGAGGQVAAAGDAGEDGWRHELQSLASSVTVLSGHQLTVP